MKRKGIVTVVVLLVLGGMLTHAQQSGSAIDLENYKKEVITSDDLAGWDFWGMGKTREEANFV